MCVSFLTRNRERTSLIHRQQGKNTQTLIFVGARQIQPLSRSKSSPSSVRGRCVVTLSTNSSGTILRGTFGLLFYLLLNSMEGRVLPLSLYLESACNQRLYRWMTFCPEWVIGSPNLDTSKVWNFWVYVVVRIMSVSPLVPSA